MCSCVATGKIIFVWINWLNDCNFFFYNITDVYKYKWKGKKMKEMLGSQRAQRESVRTQRAHCSEDVGDDWGIFVLKPCLPSCQKQQENKKCLNDAAAANEISTVLAEQSGAFKWAESFLACFGSVSFFSFSFLVFGLTPCIWNRPKLSICGLWLRAADLQVNTLQTVGSVLVGVTRLKKTTTLFEPEQIQGPVCLTSSA